MTTLKKYNENRKLTFRKTTFTSYDRGAKADRTMYKR